MTSSQKSPPLIQTFKIFLIGILGSTLLRAINITLRWKIVGFDGKEQHWPTQSPRIIAFWHGRQLMMPWIYIKHRATSGNKPFVSLISEHQDGRMISKIIEFLGIGTIRGSSSRRGTASMFELIKKLQNGTHVAITPDGPKGPVNELKGGVIRIAQRSGTPIYPAAISSSRKWIFGSWDSMILPKPFSRAVLMMGNPISVPEKLDDKDLAHYVNLVQDSLNTLTEKADAFHYH